MKATASSWGLGEHDEQFAAIFTYAALGPLEGYSSEEFRQAFATQASLTERPEYRRLADYMRRHGQP